MDSNLCYALARAKIHSNNIPYVVLSRFPHIITPEFKKCLDKLYNDLHGVDNSFLLTLNELNEENSN